MGMHKTMSTKTEDVTLVCGSHNATLSLDLRGDSLKYLLQQAFVAAAVDVNRERNKKRWTSFSRLRGSLRGNFTELPTITDTDVDNIRITIDNGCVINVVLTDNPDVNKAWFNRAVKEIYQKTPTFGYETL